MNSGHTPRLYVLWQFRLGRWDQDAGEKPKEGEATKKRAGETPGEPGTAGKKIKIDIGIVNEGLDGTKAQKFTAAPHKANLPNAVACWEKAGLWKCNP